MSLTYSTSTDRRAATTTKIVVTGSVAFDNSYPTGGEVFDSKKIGLRYLDSLVFEDSGAFSFQYDYTNNKVKAFIAGVEVANATDLSALTVVRFVAIGT